MWEKEATKYCYIELLICSNTWVTYFHKPVKIGKTKKIHIIFCWSVFVLALRFKYNVNLEVHEINQLSLVSTHNSNNFNAKLTRLIFYLQNII